MLLDDYLSRSQILAFIGYRVLLDLVYKLNSHEKI